MAFEKIALANAEACAIEGAYFCQGTMFFSADGATEDAVSKFQEIYPKTIVSNAGDEVAVDFVG
jgi:hypothetical protein